MRELSIGKRLYLAFGFIVALAFISGWLVNYKVKKLGDSFDVLLGSYSGIELESKEVVLKLLNARRQEKNYLTRKDDLYIAQIKNTIKGIRSSIGLITELAQKIKLPDGREKTQKMLLAVEAYEGHFSTMVALVKQRGNPDSGLEGQVRLASEKIESLLNRQGGQDDLKMLYLGMCRYEKDFLLTQDNKFWDLFQKTAGDFKIQAQGKSMSRAGLLVQAIGDYQNTASKLRENLIQAKEKYPLLRDTARAVEAQARALAKQVKTLIAKKREQALQQMEITSTWIQIGVISLGLFLAALSFFFTRSITRPIKKVISRLSGSAGSMALVSRQVSEASSSLAAGSSQQAASLEETAASLEEVSSMTRANAENAAKADLLMDKNQEMVKHANKRMEGLNLAMREVARSSEETFAILKTIDEIAFQTNILALNAAVEAARAGQAGAGFSVVAEEVGNLAGRTAQAARNTSQLIQENLEKIKSSARLLEEANQFFSEVSVSSGEAGELVSEISSASAEQSQGVEQINQAVSEMDNDLQTRATEAQRSAEIAEGMKRHSKGMADMVIELQSLVYGSAKEPFLDRAIPPAMERAKALPGPNTNNN
ncbi:methyl-accepting chemotaxis protein [Dethiosulfatarculus sandiegensis]|uniref:Methyl-accepting chemotaxis protein n=1 Tax=Dethiosulfatarculus sandiegensis TaxID=1429043 RepID=A0A0D2J949_9BACT|nr:methyl-accepting chemotaxis protein [Dethiosulfatarculus sandiegensis]KIX14689.1 methyl-accepting chemotaxis protein [Dethiosulfatarculus sandiegensis]